MPIDLTELIRQYASPAANAGVSMQGRNAMTDRYAALTGDPFADPFKDNEDQRYQAAMQAAMNGASVSSGGVGGPRVLTPMTSSLPVGPTTVPVAAPLNAMGVPLTNTGNRAVDNSLLTSMLQQQGNRYKMAGADLSIPSPSANNYLSILDKRAALAGASDLHGEIYRSDPTVFDKGTAADDPRFARTPIGKDGKVEAADALHPVAMTERFIQEARRNPARAAAYYSAVTGGRDYDTDVKAKSQLLAEQHDSRQKIIGGLKQITADPITGKLSEDGGVDPLTGMIRPPRPLTAYETAVVNSEKGTQRETGVQIPGFGGISLTGLSPAGKEEFQRRTQQLMTTGKLSAQDAAALAQKQMHAEQNRGKVTTLQPTNRPGPVRAMDSLTNFLGSGVNWLGTMPETANKAIFDPFRAMGMDLPHTNIPRLHIPSPEESDASYERGAPDREALMAVMKMMFAGGPAQ